MAYNNNENSRRGSWGDDHDAPKHWRGSGNRGGRGIGSRRGRGRGRGRGGRGVIGRGGYQSSARNRDSRGRQRDSSPAEAAYRGDPDAYLANLPEDEVGEGSSERPGRRRVRFGDLGRGGEGEEDVQARGAQVVGEEKLPEWDEKKVLSLHSPSGYNIAAAYFDPEDRKLYVMEDTKDTAGWDLAVLAMEQVSPDHIIMSSKAFYTLIEKVETYCKENACSFTLQAKSNFMPSSATAALTSLRLPGLNEPPRAPPSPPSSAVDPNQMTDEDRKWDPEEVEGAGLGKMRLAIVKLASWLNTDASAAVCAAGGLISYLIKVKSSSGTLQEASEGTELDGIEGLNLDQFMLINQDALNSLAVFSTEDHAYADKAGKTKDALSLYGSLNTCVTPAGKRLLHTWCLRPLLSLDAIAERHNAVAKFSNPDHQYDAGVARTQMKRIGNISRVMALLRRGRGTVHHWKILAEASLPGLNGSGIVADVKALTASLMVRDQILPSGEVNLEIIEKVKAIVDETIHRFARDVTQIDNGRICIRRGVDEYLDEKRAEYAGLTSQLDAIASRIMEDVDASFCDELVVKYIPQLGFLLVTAPLDPQLAPPEGWLESFHNDEQHYYKNQQMSDLDAHYGDMENDMADREIEIVQDLVEQLRRVDGNIMAVSEVMAELDCLLALAQAADTYNLKRPEMVAEPVLQIDRGRHLLQELLVPQYIPNDTFLEGGQGEKFCSMMVLTGANGSGKSAYGKQVALIVFMAQIGSFVPAEYARIGICDRIYTRLQTKESASKTGSAFMIDLSQVSLALRGATERSLIILDEFGKGTTPADGAGLLVGVMNHLISNYRPRTVVMTHFHDVFTQQFLDPDLPILFCHMKTVIVEGAKVLTYLYKVVPAVSYNSNAAECALMHGIPEDIVERAKEVNHYLSTNQLSKLLDQDLTPDEHQELQDAEKLMKLFLRWEINEETDDVGPRFQEMIAEVYPEYGDEEDAAGETTHGVESEAAAQAPLYAERGMTEVEPDYAWPEDVAGEAQ